MHVRFKVWSHNKKDNLFGDGFALWYTKDRMEKGNVFGAKNTFVGKRPELSHRSQ